MDMVDAQWGFTAQYEGVFPFIYADEKGYPTCGAGFLLPSKEALKEWAWEPSILDAEADYLVVKASNKGMGIQYYRRLTHARMTPESIREGFYRRIVALRKKMEVDWGLSKLPQTVQLCLVDLAYQLGLGGLNKFVKLKQAVWARDWAAASQQVSVKGAQPARTLARQQAFLSLV